MEDNKDKSFCLKLDEETEEKLRNGVRLLDAIEKLESGKRNAPKELYKFVENGTITQEKYEELIEKHRIKALAKSKTNPVNEEAAMFFAITPFAFAYALMNFEPGWRMLLEAFAAFILYSFIFGVFYNAYLSSMSQYDTKGKRIYKTIIAVIVSFLLTYIVLSRCNII